MASLVQIQYALALAREKSFMRAAKKCFVTQPTLSMQLQKLEEELDVVLFDRSRKPIVSTEAGAVILKQFQKVWDEFQRVGDIINGLKGDLAGEYRFAVIPTLAPSILPDLLANMAQRYPQVSLSARELTTDQIIEQLKQGDIDAGILSTPLKDPFIHEERLFYEPLVIYHSRQLDLESRNNQLVPLESLPFEKMVVLNQGHCLRTQILDLCASMVSTKTRLGFEVEAASLNTIMNLVQKGPYFTVLPDLATQTLSRSQQGRYVKKFWGLRPIREVSLVTHRKMVKKNLNQAIVRLIWDILPDLPRQAGKQDLILSPI